MRLDQFLRNIVVSHSSWASDMRKEGTYIHSRVTGCDNGNVAKMKMGEMKQTEMMLTAKPELPRLQRRAGSGAPNSRRQMRQLMVIR